MDLGPLILTEPMTLATDYALGVLAVVFQRRLHALSGAGPVRDWGWAFFALAVGAFAGGTAHGFALYLGPLAKTLIWKATVYSIGVAVFFMFSGTARAVFSRKTARWLVALAGVKLAVYLLWMTFHNHFSYVVYDYAPTMLAVLALSLWIARKQSNPAGYAIALGVVVSFVGAAVQLAEVRFHEYLHTNDIYHLIQMVGLWFFYRGARGLQATRAS